MEKEQQKSKFQSLDTKTKVLYVFLIIITLGIFYLVVQHKIKKLKNEKENNESKLTKKEINPKKISFDIDKLIELLGTKENIEKVEASLSSIKVLIKDKSKVNINDIKELTKKGVMISQNQVSVILGDQSETTKTLIEEKIKE